MGTLHRFWPAFNFSFCRGLFFQISFVQREGFRATFQISSGLVFPDRVANAVVKLQAAGSWSQDNTVGFLFPVPFSPLCRKRRACVVPGHGCAHVGLDLEIA
eukprot:Hpha_TRINITY_DN10363_c0_g1::TRINITY_DN10363_c0_g1_i1::g.116274::m.116274